MVGDTFKALVLDEAKGTVTAAFKELSDSDLPDGEVTVRISHSTVNYKDGMILNGIGRMVRKYPHVPGIDFVGIVESSRSARWAPGDPVILTGWRVGEAHWGGYAEKARVAADWLVRLPDGMSPIEAMALGTAGFTAMLAVMALEDAGVRPESGEVLVTGANGGLGGVAIALLGRLGYRVVASTGRAEAAAHLRSLGAAEVVSRDDVMAPPDRPLAASRWAGAVDAVGGATLASILAALKPGGAAAACGNAAGNRLETSVLPFILRGVRLIGIESAMCPPDTRATAWRRLNQELPKEALARLTHIVPFEALPALGRQILEGRTEGRVVVEIADPR